MKKNIRKRLSNCNIRSKKGITLIALIVTIIVLLILAGVSISAIWGGEGIFSRTTEVAFKTELAKIKEEYEIYIADKMLENMDFQRETLSAYVTSLYYDGMPKDEVGNIYTVLKNSKREEVGKFEITKGELYYASPDEKERKWAEDLGIKLNPYIVRDGVLLSREDNLGLTGDNTGTLVIPETVGGQPVTAIAAGAFGLTEGIRKIVIPATVTEIRDNAFYNNRSLEEIEFQTKIENGVEVGLKTIGQYAFALCTNLVSIKIPNTVTSMGQRAFDNCTKLKSIELSNNLTKIDNYTFSYCKALEEIIIPDKVNELGNLTFRGCSSLKKVKMSVNVSKLNAAFSDCSKLTDIDVEGNPSFTFENGILFNKEKTEIQFILSSAIVDKTLTIPNTVTSIGNGLINAYNTQINKVIIPASVDSIDFRFFTDNIDTIEIDKDNKIFIESEGSIYNKNKTTLHYLYKQGTTLAKDIQSITINDENIKTLDRNALYNCTNLKELKIGKDVTNINYSWIWADKLEKLTSITIDELNSSYTAEGMAIYNKNKTILYGVAGRSITEIEIANTVRTIELNAFYAQNITKITIPKGVEIIKNEAFMSCLKLEEIEIPETVTTIAYNAFSNCTSLAKGRGILINNKPGSIPDPNNNSWGAGAGDRVVHWLKSEQTQ